LTGQSGESDRRIRFYLTDLPLKKSPQICISD
jgi:hypothetical protein